jgi:deazaflavin-dependent oxidoreductase (nitroreductase family)
MTMLRALRRLIGTVLFGVALALIVFVVGMRMKSPAVIDTVRRISRASKPYVLRTAGQPGAPASVVRHVGRTSGREYETPVTAIATDEGFVIALPYGQRTDWLRNVLASGSATILDEGGMYAVDQPEVIPTIVAEPDLPPQSLTVLRVLRVEECLRLRRVPDDAR